MMAHGGTVLWHVHAMRGGKLRGGIAVKATETRRSSDVKPASLARDQGAHARKRGKGRCNGCGVTATVLQGEREVRRLQSASMTTVCEL